MLLGWLKILTKRNYICTYISKVLYRLNYFLSFLSKAEHNSALCTHTTFLQRFQYFHTAPVFSLNPDLPGQSFYRFNIMAYHFRRGIDYALNIFLLSFEIWDQCFKRC